MRFRAKNGRRVLHDEYLDDVQVNAYRRQYDHWLNPPVTFDEYMRPGRFSSGDIRYLDGNHFLMGKIGVMICLGVLSQSVFYWNANYTFEVLVA